VIARSAVRSVARLCLRRPRTRDLVAQEYDLGNWARLASQRQWVEFDDFADWVRGNDNRPIIALINGVLCRIPQGDYVRFKRLQMQAILASYADPTGDLVEIGSGYGNNLFGLRATGAWGQLTGLELSPTGIRAGREIAAHFGCRDMEFGSIDLTDAAHAGFQRLRDRTVFSHYCLEQLNSHTPEVIANLLAARPKRVIHIEPGTELLRWTRPLEAVTGLYVLSRDYQRRLLEVLRRQEAERRLQIVDCRRAYFAPSAQNFPLVVVWQPAHADGAEALE
jgi:SAM-dependent methyltransferase